jgi:sialate O-acetylesterase
VLQRGKPLPVWGTAAPHDTVTVTFRGQSQRAVAGNDGRWEVRLKPLAATAEPADLVVAGHNIVTVHDVVVGDVWLCSGQSNMDFTVNSASFTYRVENADAEVAAANFPLIRQLRIERSVAQAPAATARTSGWKPASPETVGDFTAIGYFFARDIQTALGIPVGIVLSSWPGTPIESWMSDGALASTSVAGAVAQRWEKALSEWPPDRVARHAAATREWQKSEVEAAAAHGRNPIPWPGLAATNDSAARPGGLYNGMIAPLQSGALRGILWYQGESNVPRAGEYAELFRSMIRSWRSGWGQGDLPFYFVQVAALISKDDPDGRSWARLREAQAEALKLPGTGMAVAIDNSDPLDVHPKNKQVIGRRLALIAEARLFGRKVEYSGPVLAGMTLDRDALRLRFGHAGARLVAHGDAVKSLEIAGADRVFHAASGIILGDELRVSSPEVPRPVAARYAWSNAPEANLYNEAGLPAVPFRTDSW